LPRDQIPRWRAASAKEFKANGELILFIDLEPARSNVDL